MSKKKRIRFIITLVLLVVSIASLISIGVNVEKMTRGTKAVKEALMTLLPQCGTLAADQATSMPLFEIYRQNKEMEIALLETQVAITPFTAEWSLRLIDHQVEISGAPCNAPLIILCPFRECLDQYSFTESVKWMFDPNLEGDFERVRSVVFDYIESTFLEVHFVNLISLDENGEIDSIIPFDL